jgi:hypothetical protein
MIPSNVNALWSHRRGESAIRNLARLGKIPNGPLRNPAAFGGGGEADFGPSKIILAFYFSALIEV